uniref:Uncharacterized protein n=1 Tax=Cajanus cajan TaxID=3821 RepID=A0A151RQ21_CAJCA|nr:hypothetical protein KK1_033865 [Cajanus cajan]
MNEQLLQYCQKEIKDLLSKNLNIIIFETNPPPMRENPTIIQIKAYEEKSKKDKVITCLHVRLAYHIFTKIMDLKHLNRYGTRFKMNLKAVAKSNLLCFSH